MEYEFKLHVNTDGDFGFKYIPANMKYNGYDEYILEIVFIDENAAREYMEETVEFLKMHITGRESEIKIFTNMVNKFTQSINANPDANFYTNEMGGNYEGTFITYKKEWM